MELPFGYVYRGDDRLDDIHGEADLTGDEIRDRIVTVAKEWGLLWRAERNIRGINECPFDLVLGDEAHLDMCAVEIKGDTDNYERLSKQMANYLFGFGIVYLALHKKDAPRWLPEEVGIIKVLAGGEVLILRRAIERDPLSVSTEWEWDGLFKANGLGGTYKHARRVLGLVGNIRRNLIFNRFFAIPDPDGKKRFERFYPFSDEQKEVIVGMDIEYHHKQIRKDITEIERRVEVLKKACSITGDQQLKLL